MYSWVLSAKRANVALDLRNEYFKSYYRAEGCTVTEYMRKRQSNSAPPKIAHVFCRARFELNCFVFSLNVNLNILVSAFCG